MRNDLGILFDLDSTLIDSSNSVRTAWIQLAGEAGFALQDLAGLHGIPAEGCLRILLPGQPESEIQRWLARIEHLEMTITDGIAPNPGASELLSELNERHIPWTIVTSGTRPLATERLRVAGITRPETIVTFSDVTNGKPHPEPFLLGAARIGVAPENCWVIEDAHSGVTAGKAAGCIVAAVLTTHSREELPHADHHMENLLDLLDLIG
jgi:sugar-phosphatase